MAVDGAHALDGSDLDALIERHDTVRFHRLMETLPQQAHEAWAMAAEWSPPAHFRPPGRVILAGVGGSAIGPDVVATLAGRAGSVPVEVVRDYALPPLDEHALVIASSFSGDTEETLDAFEAAGAAGCMRVALTSGGRLADAARAAGVPLFQYQWSGPPRTAIGYGVFITLGVLRRLEAIEVSDAALEAAFAALESGVRQWGTDASDNEAKRLAEDFAGRLPVLIGPDILAVAARRWASDIGENAKQWAFWYALPEFDHNQLEGVDAPATAETLEVVLLDAPAVHPRNRRRIQATAAEMQSAGCRVHTVTVDGDEPLEAMLLACSFASWNSYYLSLLNGVDAASTPRMAAFKGRLHSER